MQNLCLNDKSLHVIADCCRIRFVQLAAMTKSSSARTSLDVGFPCRSRCSRFGFSSTMSRQPLKPRSSRNMPPNVAKGINTPAKKTSCLAIDGCPFDCGPSMPARSAKIKRQGPISTLAIPSKTIRHTYRPRSPSVKTRNAAAELNHFQCLPTDCASENVVPMSQAVQKNPAKRSFEISPGREIRGCEISTAEVFNRLSGNHYARINPAPALSSPNPALSPASRGKAFPP